MSSFKTIPGREWQWLMEHKERLAERNDFALSCRFGMHWRPDFPLESAATVARRFAEKKNETITMH
jgi:hypothetical protein